MWYHLFFQDDTVDLRQIYLSVAAVSGFVSFKSLLYAGFTVSWCVYNTDDYFDDLLNTTISWYIAHSMFVFVFQLFDKEARGSLSAEELSGLMGALLGFPQHNTAELYAQASNQGQLTKGESWG